MRSSTPTDGQSGSETAGQEIETDTEMLYDRNPRREIPVTILKEVLCREVRYDQTEPG